MEEKKQNELQEEKLEELQDEEMDDVSGGQMVNPSLSGGIISPLKIKRDALNPATKTLSPSALNKLVEEYKNK